MPTMPNGAQLPPQALQMQPTLKPQAPNQAAQVATQPAGGPGQGGAATAEGVQAAAQQAGVSATPSPTHGSAAPPAQPATPAAGLQTAPPPTTPTPGFVPNAQGQVVYPPGQGPVTGKVNQIAPQPNQVIAAEPRGAANLPLDDPSLNPFSTRMASANWDERLKKLKERRDPTRLEDPDHDPERDWVGKHAMAAAGLRSAADDQEAYSAPDETDSETEGDELMAQAATLGKMAREIATPAAGPSTAAPSRIWLVMPGAGLKTAAESFTPTADTVKRASSLHNDGPDSPSSRLTMPAAGLDTAANVAPPVKRASSLRNDAPGNQLQPMPAAGPSTAAARSAELVKRAASLGKGGLATKPVMPVAGLDTAANAPRILKRASSLHNDGLDTTAVDAVQSIKRAASLGKGGPSDTPFMPASGLRSEDSQRAVATQCTVGDLGKMAAALQQNGGEGTSPSALARRGTNAQKAAAAIPGLVQSPAVPAAATPLQPSFTMPAAGPSTATTVPGGHATAAPIAAAARPSAATAQKPIMPAARPQVGSQPKGKAPAVASKPLVPMGTGKMPAVPGGVKSSLLRSPDESGVPVANWNAGGEEALADWYRALQPQQPRRAYVQDKAAAEKAAIGWGSLAKGLGAAALGGPLGAAAVGAMGMSKGLGAAKPPAIPKQPAVPKPPAPPQPPMAKPVAPKPQPVAPMPQQRSLPGGLQTLPGRFPQRGTPLMEEFFRRHNIDPGMTPPTGGSQTLPGVMPWQRNIDPGIYPPLGGGSRPGQFQLTPGLAKMLNIPYQAPTPTPRLQLLKAGELEKEANPLVAAARGLGGLAGRMFGKAAPAAARAMGPVAAEAAPAVMSAAGPRAAASVAGEGLANAATRGVGGMTTKAIPEAVRQGAMRDAQMSAIQLEGRRAAAAGQPWNMSGAPAPAQAAAARAGKGLPPSQGPTPLGAGVRPGGPAPLSGPPALPGTAAPAAGAASRLGSAAGSAAKSLGKATAMGAGMTAGMAGADSAMKSIDPQSPENVAAREAGGQGGFVEGLKKRVGSFFGVDSNQVEAFKSLQGELDAAGIKVMGDDGKPLGLDAIMEQAMQNPAAQEKLLKQTPGLLMDAMSDPEKSKPAIDGMIEQFKSMSPEKQQAFRENPELQRFMMEVQGGGGGLTGGLQQLWTMFQGLDPSMQMLIGGGLIAGLVGMVSGSGLLTAGGLGALAAGGLGAYYGDEIGQMFGGGGGGQQPQQPASEPLTGYGPRSMRPISPPDYEQSIRTINPGLLQGRRMEPQPVPQRMP